MPSYELSGSVSEKEKLFIETWENVGLQVNYIIRENRRGDEVHEEVRGAKRFKLSSYDRMLTEDKITDLRLNPFKNGCFRPVLVPDDVTIESNPNAMSSTDIERLFGASDVAWNEYMAVIDSPSTLKRMIDMADNGEAELSHRRYQELTSMYDRFSNIGKRVVSSKDPEIQAKMDTMGGSVSEPSPSAARRGRPVKTHSPLSIAKPGVQAI